MVKQIISMFVSVAVLVIVLGLFFWKRKKNTEYKDDERWQTVQDEADKVANSAVLIALLLVIMGATIAGLFNVQITMPLSLVATCGMLFLGLRDATEIFALNHFNKQY